MISILVRHGMLPLSLGAALVMGGCVAEVLPSDTWVTYSSPHGTFSVEYPENWDFAEIEPGDEGVPADLLGHGVVFASGGVGAGASLVLGLLDSEVRPSDLTFGVLVLEEGFAPSAQGFAELIRSQDKRLMVGYEEVHFRPTMVDEEEGVDYQYRFVGEAAQGDTVEAVNRQLFVMKGRHLFVFQASALAGSFQRNKKSVDRFFGSIRLATSQAENGEGETPRDTRGLAHAIRDELEALIEERALPYEVTQAEFQRIGSEVEKIREKIGRPGGTWWIVQFEDPLVTGIASELPTEDLFLYKPLELFRDSLAPFWDELDFVSYFLISFRDADQTTFEVPPEALQAYIDGELSNEQMSHEIIITQLARG